MENESATTRKGEPVKTWLGLVRSTAPNLAFAFAKSGSSSTPYASGNTRRLQDSRSTGAPSKTNIIPLVCYRCPTVAKTSPCCYTDQWATSILVHKAIERLALKTGSEPEVAVSLYYFIVRIRPM